MFTVFTRYTRILVIGTFAALATFVLFYLMTVFALSWGTSALKYSRETFLLLQLLGVVFFAITIPMICEVLVVSAVFIVIGGLNAFELVWLLTSQDPNTSTHTLGTLMVTSMFKEFQIGRATAIAVVLFGLVFLLSAAVMRALKREAIE